MMYTQPATRERSRVAAFDGLRGIAIAAVLAFHAAPSLAPGGFLGVEVFFVLSGYLLTSRLLDQERRYGRIDWVRYARTRVRRLAPALAGFLMVMVLVGATLARPDSYRLRGDLLWSALGLTNWHLVSDGTSYFRQLGRPPLVRHLWSLAVEIQFYAIVPLILAGLLRLRRLAALAALWLAIGLSTLLLGVLHGGGDPARAYYGTDARIGALLTGVLLAVLALPDGDDRLWARRARVLGAVGLGTLLPLFALVGEGPAPLFVTGFLLCRLATVLLIAGATVPGGVASGLGWRPLRWLGLRSYSIYLWHWPLVVLLRPGIDVTWPAAVTAVVTVAGSLALGHLSFEMLERPFLRSARARLDRAPVAPLFAATRRINATVAAVGTSIVLFSLPTTDPIAESLEAGRQVLATQSSSPATSAMSSPVASTTAPPDPAATLAISGPAVVAAGAVSEPAPPAAPPLPPGPPPGTMSVTAIGDSVMVSAAGPLQERLGEGAYIDAKLSRQFAQGVGVARQLREEGRLGQVVLVHLGTNGPPKASDIDALMAELTGVPQVRLVTVRMPQRWEAATNQALVDAAGRYPSVQIVDWYGYSEGRREWFESDGTHVKRSGARAYADLLVSSIGAPAEPAPVEPAPAEPPPPEPAPAEPTPTTQQPPLIEAPAS